MGAVRVGLLLGAILPATTSPARRGSLRLRRSCNVSSTRFPVEIDNPQNGNMYKPIYFNVGQASHGAK